MTSDYRYLKRNNKNNSDSNSYNNSKLRLQCTEKLNPQHITALSICDNNINFTSENSDCPCK